MKQQMSGHDGKVVFALSRAASALAVSLPILALRFRPFGHEWKDGQRVILHVSATTLGEFSEYVLRHAQDTAADDRESDPYAKGICVANTVEEVAREDEDAAMLVRMVLIQDEKKEEMKMKSPRDLIPLFELLHVASVLCMSRLKGECLSALAVAMRSCKTKEQVELQLREQAKVWNRGHLRWNLSPTQGWYEATWK
jgi:hypothetical protein